MPGDWQAFRYGKMTSQAVRVPYGEGLPIYRGGLGWR